MRSTLKWLFLGFLIFIILWFGIRFLHSQSKDQLFSSIQSAAPQTFCQNYSLHKTSPLDKVTGPTPGYATCITVVNAAIKQCKDKYYNQMPATLNYFTPGHWHQKVMGCVTGNAYKNLYNKVQYNPALR